MTNLKFPRFIWILLTCLVVGYASALPASTNDLQSFYATLATRNDPKTITTGSVPAVNNSSSLELARLLGPNDVISVAVYQEEDLNTETSVDKNGMVMLPLLGQIKISGMTVKQATDYIQNLYNKDYLVNPQVNLTVEQFAPRRFTVLGQVQRPDSYDFPQNESVNLLEAIAISGGYTRLGAPSKVDVRRIINGTPKIYHLDAGEMSKNSNAKIFEVLPDDIITVGERDL
jgi:polysaccharide export outer membrane protein